MRRGNGKKGGGMVEGWGRGRGGEHILNHIGVISIIAMLREYLIYVILPYTVHVLTSKLCKYTVQE